MIFIATMARTINEGTGNEIKEGTIVEVRDAPDGAGTWPYIVRPYPPTPNSEFIAAQADDLKDLPTKMYIPSVKQDQTRENNFIYHAPKPGQADRYAAIRSTAKLLAQMLDEQCPQSRELSLAMTNLEQAVFWANAAIARHE